ncbi:MAG: CRISPR-associated CARF protein Csa3 [Candidatus Njordarchaeales archaeon]
MGKSFLITFGWNENVVINLTVRFPILPGDKFILVLPLEAEDPRSKRAIQTLKNFFDKHYPRVTVKELPISIKDFRKAVLRILDLIVTEVKKGSDVYVNVSGGMRILALTTYTAALIAKEIAKGKIFLVDLEIEGLQENVTLYFPPLSLPKIKDTELEILRSLLKYDSILIDNLVAQLRISRSTLYRRIGELKRLGMVRIKKRNKRSAIELTETGKMYLEIIARYEE